MLAVNITQDIYNIVLGVIVFLSILASHLNETNHDDLNKLHRWFHFMMFINILMSVSDIFVMAFNGNSRPINYIILPAALFIYYALGFMLLGIMYIELKIFLDRINKLKYCKNLFFRIIILSIVTLFILLILTPFKKVLYQIDENNIYSRAHHFYLIVIVQLVLYINLIFYMLVNRKTIGKTKVSITISFLFIPQLSEIIQFLIPGLSVINTGYSIVFLIMFIFSNSFSNKELKTTELKLSEKETEIYNQTTQLEKSKSLIIKMQDHTIESLSNLVENRDEDTGEHVIRTMTYVELLAIQLMKKNLFSETITPRYIRYLKRAAPMHDIGKIVVPDAILKKPARFTEEEFNQMKRHATEGGRIVHEILDGYEEPEYIQITTDIAAHHHERWDGSGYPDKLSGEEIPLSARIMALADVFDALVSERIYKEPMTYEEAFKIIEDGKGSHFDPVIAQEFLNIKEKIVKVNESFKSTVNSNKA